MSVLEPRLFLQAATIGLVRRRALEWAGDREARTSPAILRSDPSASSLAVLSPGALATRLGLSHEAVLSVSRAGGVDAALVLLHQFWAQVWTLNEPDYSLYLTMWIAIKHATQAAQGGELSDPDARPIHCGMMMRHMPGPWIDVLASVLAETESSLQAARESAQTVDEWVRAVHAVHPYYLLLDWNAQLAKGRWSHAEFVRLARFVSERIADCCALTELDITVGPTWLSAAFCAHRARKRGGQTSLIRQWEYLNRARIVLPDSLLDELRPVLAAATEKGLTTGEDADFLYSGLSPVMTRAVQLRSSTELWARMAQLRGPVA